MSTVTKRKYKQNQHYHLYIKKRKRNQGHEGTSVVRTLLLVFQSGQAEGTINYPRSLWKKTERGRVCQNEHSDEHFSHVMRRLSSLRYMQLSIHPAMRWMLVMLEPLRHSCVSMLSSSPSPPSSKASSSSSFLSGGFS